jgi:hypothetical protein
MYYIGDVDSSAKWKNENPQVAPLGTHFDQGLDKMLAALRVE